MRNGNNPEQPRHLPIDFKDWCSDPEALPVGPQPGLAEEIEAIIQKYEPRVAAAKLVQLFNSTLRSLREGDDK